MTSPPPQRGEPTAPRGLASLFTIPREPVARFRLFALGFTFFTAIGNGIDVAMTSGVPTSARLLGFLAGIGLSVWYWRAWRRGGFPAGGWLVDLVLLVLLSRASEVPLRAMGAYFAAMQFRALYVAPRHFWLLPVAICGARLLAIVFPIDATYVPNGFIVFMQVVGLTLIGATILAFRTAVERLTETERALTRSEERYRLIAAASRDIIYEWNIATDTVERADRTAPVFGYAPEDVGPTRDWWREHVHPEDLASFDATVAQALHAPPGQMLSIRCRMRRADGRYAALIVTAIVQHGPDGKPERALGSLRDVTAEQQLEEQLRQSQKLEAVGQLAGGVAHDFNNMLTVIGGHVYLLERSVTPTPTIERHLAGITKTADRAANLTKQLLAFSRKQLLKPTVLNLNAVVNDVTQMIRGAVGERVIFVSKLDPLLAPALADAGQLEQVLVNLALNARDAMPEGGTITIETANAVIAADENGRGQGSALPPGAYVRLAVSDTGTGMDAATLARAFEPFFTTKPAGRGTGLGLATVYGIVRQSFGDVWATSVPGQGTTVTIMLPVAKEAELAAAAGRQVASGSLDRELVNARTVLLVEDDDGVRVFANEVLVRNGFHVLTARNGADGLRVAREHGYAFDLVVTDVVMPEMNGRQMVEQLRLEKPNVHVLYISGYVDTLQNRAEFEVNDARLLGKPFTAAALERAVAAIEH
jgi:two-component system cell cycle sensor histidine kinase/response regulator CckA